MRPTRRLAGVTAAATAFAVAALSLQDPRFLLGAGGLAAWVLLNQLRFATILAQTNDTTTVSQAIQPPRTGENTPVTYTLDVETPPLEGGTATLELDPPAAATGLDASSISIEREIQSTTQQVSFPVAGRHRFGDPTLAVESANGLFTESLPLNSTASIRVEPRYPREIHVGEGGEELSRAFGEHRGERGQQSTETSELRAYEPSDPANRIDWNATARLGTPFVREFEAAIERPTLLIVDHRATMDTGSPGETKLEYARELALAVAEHARENDDPLALTTVGDDGITGRFTAGATNNHYERIRTHLADITPTERTSQHAETRGEPERAYRNARRLADDDSAFAETLQPYFAEAETYVERLSDHPLFGAVEQTITTHHGSPWIVLLTDDTSPIELRETVKLARGDTARVAAFVAPTVLFETHGLTDLDEAYERYVAFEDDRRRLDHIDRVRAYEYAPGDRIDALLAARTPRTP